MLWRSSHRDDASLGKQPQRGGDASAGKRGEELWRSSELQLVVGVDAEGTAFVEGFEDSVGFLVVHGIGQLEHGLDGVDSCGSLCCLEFDEALEDGVEVASGRFAFRGRRLLSGGWWDRGSEADFDFLGCDAPHPACFWHPRLPRSRNARSAEGTGFGGLARSDFFMGSLPRMRE